MILISKNVYIYKLNEIVDKYNNKYHRTIKLESVDVNLGAYIDFDIENNDKDSKFKVCDHIRISKHKNDFFRKLHSKLV